MTTPRWFVPLISTVAALAVAVAATLIGMQFAPAPSAQTQSVLVLEPVSLGADGKPITDGDPATLDTSFSNGTTEIVTPGAGNAGDIGAAAQARIAALDASDGDPASARQAVADSPEGSTPADPCAPEDGSSPEDCPEGLHSAIFADTAPEPLRVFPRADPPSGIQGSGGVVACPTRALPAGSLTFGVATTTPSTVTLRYWPANDPAAERTVTIPGDPAAEAAWNAEVARSGVYPEHSDMFQHCTTLAGLRANTVYESSSAAVDTLLRVSSEVPLEFDSRGAPTRPPMQIIPLTSSVVYVAVPTTRMGDLPWLRGWVVPEGHRADCSSFDSSTAVRRVQDEHVVEVSASSIAAANYQPAYDRRVVDVFSVPEGSTIVFCARWYDSTGPSWSRDLPRDQVSASVVSPDLYSPVVTVTGLSLVRAADARSISLSASTQFGVECGQGAYLPEADAAPSTPLTVNTLLCAPGRSDSVLYAPLGSGGNIVVTSRIGQGDSVVTNSTVLPLGRYGCLGSCPAPPTLTFQVLLPNVTVGRGMCGSSFGESCTPPTSEVALGTATLTVTWEQGSTNGQREWQVGVPAYQVPVAIAPDYPQLDTNQAITPSLSSDGFVGAVDIPIRTDRHASFRASIEGDCFIGNAPAPATGATVNLASGGQGANVHISGLCPGATYFVSVELTDSARHRAIYSYREPSPRQWRSASFRVPQNEINYTVTVQLSSISTDRQPWGTFGADVTMGGAGANEVHARFPADTCFTRDELSTTGQASGTVPQERVVHLSVYARVVTEGLYQGVNRDATCSWGDQVDDVLNLESDISYADLLRGVTFAQNLRPSWAGDASFTPSFRATITVHGSRA
ncbi:MAG: hypothetical protein EPN91_08045 [Salinibacterium sp.]|nr:MAG: hypothetical protein EPN91_08045 [Salinibacterium sp.]